MSSEKYTRLLNSTDAGSDQVESTYCSSTEGNNSQENNESNPALNGEILNRNPSNGGGPYIDPIIENDEDVPRMFTMIQNEPSSQASAYSAKRLFFSGILFGALCMVLGILIGITTGRSMVSSVIPSPSPIAPSQQVQPAEFFDNVPGTTTPDLKDLIPEISVEFLKHFTPELIKKYMLILGKSPTNSVPDLVSQTLMGLGYKVERRVFQTKMAAAFTETPNTVEIVYGDNSTKIVNENPDSLEDIEPFAAYSPNATVSGPLVYGHFGSMKDLDTLKAANVIIEGAILLLRIGEVHNSVQVNNAFKFGAKGILLYPDPEEFAQTDANTPDAKEKALPVDGVVWQNLKPIGGDPSSPGYPGLRGVYRAPAQMLPIPVQPISAESAQLLLQTLKGKAAPLEWHGYLNATYRLDGINLGEDKASNGSKYVKLSIHNEMVESFVHSVSAYKPAVDTTRVVHVACRYSLLGSSLTTSGLSLASLLAFADAMNASFVNGTRRQVLIHAFEGVDMEQSSGWEFAELYSSWLETTSIAYIDFSSLILGHGYIDAHASPILRQVVREAFYHVEWPEGKKVNAWQGVLRDIHRKNGQNASVGNEYQMSLDINNPSGCDECLSFYSLYGIPTIHLQSVNSNKSVPYELADSQYDKLSTFSELYDKDYKWTHMIASLLSISSVILSNTRLPPILFQELGGDIQGGWKEFMSKHSKDFKVSGRDFGSIIEQINGDLDILSMTLGSLTDWYNKESTENEQETPYQSFRKEENRISKMISITRQFLRPRNVPVSTLGSLLTFGPHPEDNCKGTYFPMLTEALLNAVSESSKNDPELTSKISEAWDNVHKELSYIYTAISAINTDLLSEVS